MGPTASFLVFNVGVHQYLTGLLEQWTYMLSPDKNALNGVNLRKQPPVHWDERWEDWTRGKGRRWVELGCILWLGWSGRFA